MNNKNFQTPFSKAFLTAAFVGIITSLICITFNGIYRDQTGLEPTDFINVSSLIFGVNILFLLLGLVFYVASRWYKTGETLYIVILLAATQLLAWKAEGVVRSRNYQITVEFRRLLLGIILIVGTAAVIAVPLLFHNKGFEKRIL